MFLLNSRNHRFFATSFCSICTDFTYMRHTFSRSYGVNLPSSFTRVISSALVFSTCRPVSVYGTVQQPSSLRGFSWKHSINHFSNFYVQSSSRLRIEYPDLPRYSPYSLKPGFPTPGRPNFLRPPFAPVTKYRNINLFPIDYASQPRLRSRLTLRRLPSRRKP